MLVALECNRWLHVMQLTSDSHDMEERRRQVVAIGDDYR